MLNQPQYAGASMLAAGVNFGCGSSREHAAWALQDAGFRVVIAPSFADIFRSNAIGNGMLPVALAEAAVNAILDRAEAGDGYASRSISSAAKCATIVRPARSASRSTPPRGSGCSKARTKSISSSTTNRTSPRSSSSELMR